MNLFSTKTLRKLSKPEDYEPVEGDEDYDLAYVGTQAPIETIYEGPAAPKGVGMASRVGRMSFPRHIHEN
jgi:hypothetical protein